MGPERVSLASIVHRRATPLTRVVGPRCLKQGAWLAWESHWFIHSRLANLTSPHPQVSDDSSLEECMA